MSQFLMNCTSLTLSQMRKKNLAISISAMVCFFVTVLMFLLMVFYKAHKSTLQRLFQYLTVVTALHLAFISCDIQLRFDVKVGPELCKWLGFARQWTATVTYFFVLGITFYLLYFVYYHLKGDPFRKITSSKCSRIFLEVVFMAIVILTPLTFLWVPFYHGTYGVYETSCWIQKIHTSDCNKSKEGTLDQIGTVVVLRVVMITVLTSFIVLSTVYCRFACGYHDTRSQHLKTVRKIFLLMLFFATSALIEITGLILYIYTAITNKTISYDFWLVYDIVMPISQLVIPIGFMVYLYSLKKFQWAVIKRAALEWKQDCKSYCRYPAKSCYARKKRKKVKCHHIRAHPGIINCSDERRQSHKVNVSSETRSLPLPHTGIASFTSPQPLVNVVGKSSYGATSHQGNECVVCGGAMQEELESCIQPAFSSGTASLTVPYTGEFTSITQPLLTESSCPVQEQQDGGVEHVNYAVCGSCGHSTDPRKKDKSSKGVVPKKNTHLIVSFNSETASVSFPYTGEFTSISNPVT